METPFWFFSESKAWKVSMKWLWNLNIPFGPYWKLLKLSSFSGCSIQMVKCRVRVTEKSICYGPFIYDVHKEGGGVILKFVMYLWILMFLSKRFIVQFCEWDGGFINLQFFMEIKNVRLLYKDPVFNWHQINKFRNFNLLK